MVWEGRGEEQGSARTYTQHLRQDIVRPSPKETRRRHRHRPVLFFFFFAPVRHVRWADDGGGVDDGHGVRGEQFVAVVKVVVVVVAEWEGQLQRLVEPE